MGDEQEDRPTPLSVYWIDGSSVHQSDPLEEAGRCGQRPTQAEKVRWLLVDFLRLKVREDFW